MHQLKAPQYKQLEDALCGRKFGFGCAAEKNCGPAENRHSTSKHLF